MSDMKLEQSAARHDLEWIAKERKKLQDTSETLTESLYTAAENANRAGVPISEIARILGMSRKHISSIVNDRRRARGAA